MNINSAQLIEAAEVAKQIEALKEKLARILGGEVVTPTVTATGKRTLSPQARAKIAAGQRKRWRKFHAEQPVAETSAPVASAPAVTPAVTPAPAPAAKPAAKPALAPAPATAVAA